jgi:hypothetical protein
MRLKASAEPNSRRGRKAGSVSSECSDDCTPLGPVFFRYADNFVFASGTISEERQALELTG